MTFNIPKMLLDSLAEDSWRNASPDILRTCLGGELDDLHLYQDIETMQRVATSFDESGIVDDPEFCMVRRRTTGDDLRLDLSRALFIGGSVFPGDDVYLALMREELTDYDPPVFVLDWRRSVPSRWHIRGSLSDLITGIEE